MSTEDQEITPETERSGKPGTEEQKPSPDVYPNKGLGGDGADAGENTEEGERSTSDSEAARPPRADPGAAAAE
jgi:hypothetical protein